MSFASTSSLVLHKYRTENTTSTVYQYLYTRFIYTRVFLIGIEFFFWLNSWSAMIRTFISQTIVYRWHLFNQRTKFYYMCRPLFPKLNPKMCLSCELCGTVCGSDGIAQAQHQREVSDCLKRYFSTVVSVFFYRWSEGIVDGCQERLECVCVCNFLCFKVLTRLGRETIESTSAAAICRGHTGEICQGTRKWLIAVLKGSAV